MCSRKLSVNEKCLLDLGGSCFQCTHCVSRSQLRNIFSLQNKQIRLYWCVNKALTLPRRHRNHFKILLEFCIVQNVKTKSVSTLGLMELLSFLTAKNVKTFVIILILYLGNEGLHCFCLVELVHKHVQPHLKLNRKTSKIFPILNLSCWLPIGWYS